jgi:hypothetical protein
MNQTSEHYRAGLFSPALAMLAETIDFQNLSFAKKHRSDLTLRKENQSG